MLDTSLFLCRVLLVPLFSLGVGAPPEQSAAVSPVDSSAPVGLRLCSAASTMQVDPPVIILRKDGANISHSGSGSLTVTATGDTGQVATIEVPAGQTVNWVPPAGWRSVIFTAPGHQVEARQIQ